MPVTNYTVLFATAGDTFKLSADVATSIAAGYQPFGAPFFDGDRICQTMTKDAPVATVYTADGAISTSSGMKVLSKTSAGAHTLAAPANDGDRIVLISGTAFAHVVTATGLLNDGVTGGSKNKVTMGAFVGACAVLLAYNGKWVLESKTVATVAA